MIPQIGSEGQTGQLLLGRRADKDADMALAEGTRGEVADFLLGDGELVCSVVCQERERERQRERQRQRRGNGPSLSQWAKKWMLSTGFLSFIA
jgi:hypothetical protein